MTGPPGLTAELYRAIAGVSGVTINTHAADVAGRPGVSFTMKVPDAAGDGTNQIVFNPHTCRLMGQQAIGLTDRPHPDTRLYGPPGRIPGSRRLR